MVRDPIEPNMSVCLFGIVFAFLTLLGKSHGQKPCSTIPGTECISLSKCAPFLSLVAQSGKLNATELDTLRKSQCGFEGTTPNVCCPIVSPETTTKPGEIPDPPDVTEHANLRLINDKTCGSVTEERIIAGNRTKVSEFPWMALIAYNISGQHVPLFACGGTLINKRYVLTAAHCVAELGSRTKVSGVRLGEHDLSKDLDCDDEARQELQVCADKIQEFSIESLHVHGDYRKKEHHNDIALIRLDRDADFKTNVLPICLPVGEAAKQKSQKGVVTGWGITEAGIRSQVLLRVRLEMAANDECDKAYSSQNVTVTYKQLCAGGKDRRDTCTGDSGGPLQIPAVISDYPRYVQFGIVSFGPANCGTVGYPGVYVRVAYYMDWILDTITE